MSDPDVEMFNHNLMKALVADNDKQRAEIERLRAENAAWKHENNLAHAEVEGLRIEVAQGNAAWKEVHIGCEAEIERLKAALREIAQRRQIPEPYGASIARAALERKFPTKKICPECGQPMREGGVCDHIPF